MDRPNKSRSTNCLLTVINRQSVVAIDKKWFRDLVFFVLKEEKIPAAAVNLVFVDNREIHELNRRFLSHDFPTDVLTFPHSARGCDLAGEIVMSADFAVESAAEHRLPTQVELGLYAVHGILHLCGYRDDVEPEAGIMQDRQEELLAAYRQRRGDPQTKAIDTTITRRDESAPTSSEGAS